jgi:hypothetical protein
VTVFALHSDLGTVGKRDNTRPSAAATATVKANAKPTIVIDLYYNTYGESRAMSQGCTKA